MANESSPLQFEDIPLDEARRMARGTRLAINLLLEVISI